MNNKGTMSEAWQTTRFVRKVIHYSLFTIHSD